MIAHSVDATERDAAGFSHTSSTPVSNKGEECSDISYYIMTGKDVKKTMASNQIKFNSN